uniref:AB hydrolase-1 domain-containing protein n=1 Tax=Helicotheca tamesis TaxID=374047 RepID=A0A7S2MD80_9STRA
MIEDHKNEDVQQKKFSHLSSRPFCDADPVSLYTNESFFQNLQSTPPLLPDRESSSSKMEIKPPAISNIMSNDAHFMNHIQATPLASTWNDVFQQAKPCLYATIHLNLRLFAPLMIIYAVSYLLLSPLCFSSPKKQINATKKENQNRFRSIISPQTVHGVFFTIASLVAIVFSAIVTTDALYVLEYTLPPLVVLHLLTILLIFHRSPFDRKYTLMITLPISILALIQILRSDLDLPAIKAGFYYKKDSWIASSIVREWPEEKRTYDDGRGTKWLLTGDARTGVPFFINHVPQQKFVRRWVPTEELGETEAIILDIAFPPDGIHRRDKPIYMVLHGLNGGSGEEYVRDFVHRRTTIDNSTVAVMITRGLMDSPILGDNLLHFARITDVHVAAGALRRAKSPDQTLAGVGYSMGAITVANYLAKMGQESNLDAAVAISGALDTRQQPRYKRSRDFWQPMLAKTLRDTLITKFYSQLSTRLSLSEIHDISLADSMISLDEKMFVRYNNYKDLGHYYSEMGAMGDFNSFNNEKDETRLFVKGVADGISAEEQGIGRIANVSFPLLCVNALDDPIAYWGTLWDPQKVANSGDGFVMLLLTEKGGHVGWPLGNNPNTDGWKWMSDVASSFVEAIDRINVTKE